MFLMKKIDFWIYVVSTEFPGENMGSPPQTNTDLASSPQLLFLRSRRTFYFFIVLIICNFFRIRKAMYKVQKVIEISSQLSSILEFCKFVDSFHSITKCTKPNCPIGNLGSKFKKKNV